MELRSKRLHYKKEYQRIRKAWFNSWIFNGGKTQSRERFNKYQISNNILSELINEWLEIKENNDFTV